MNILKNVAENLQELHEQILRERIDTSYREIYQKAKPNLEALRMKSGEQGESEIQVSLNGLYGLLILKLKRTSITGETSRAFDTIRELVAELSARYMERNPSVQQ